MLWKNFADKIDPSKVHSLPSGVAQNVVALFVVFTFLSDVGTSDQLNLGLKFVFCLNWVGYTPPTDKQM